ncbi:MAG: DUF892 family protein [Phycisphaerales bacterium]|nr:DUF892 family protein [Phycisphaerales bacterium]
MPLKTMKDLLAQQLDELLAGERHIIQVMPKLARAVNSHRLRDAIESYQRLSREHVSRLEPIFAEMDLRPRKAEARGMRGLLEDCLRLAAMDNAEAHVRDAAIIAVAQHVKHDVIAGYGCAKTWASLLGMHDAADELQRSLADERNADAELTRIAEDLNLAAVEAAV